MIPILFAHDAREYNNNGIGVLVDVGYCTVTEERNGQFELSLQYPVNGSHYKDLAIDRQILAKPNETSDPQAFRIYHISKPMSGVVTVSAEHISYELSSVIVKPFTALNVGAALSKIKTESINENRFSFLTDKTDNGQTKHTNILSARSALGGVAGSVLDVYGGEYEFDNYTVKLHQNRGFDNGVVISYSKNLTGVKCEEKGDGIVTGAIAYWSKETDGVVQSVYGDLQTIKNNLSYSRNVVVDCSSEFEEAPSKESLNDFASKYIRESKNAPFFSVSVEFVNLGDTEEYKQYKSLYRVNLCDIVTVKHPLYGIDVKAKVVKTVFDSVREKYEKIEIGEVSANISQTISAQAKEIGERVTFSQLDNAILSATNAITGNKGGYVVLNPPSNPQELLILDKPKIEEATNVWRWNLAGLGHSGTGYNGRFTTAITADGQIVADFITTGKLSANIISSGSIVSNNGLSTFSLDSGSIQVGGSEFNTTIGGGHITQYAKSFGGETGGITPVASGSNFWQGIYYKNGASGVSINKSESGDTLGVADISIDADSVIKTNPGKTKDIPYGITHFRKSTFNGTSSVEQVNFGISKTKEDRRACICLEHGAGGNATALARMDIYKSPTTASLVTVRFCSVGTYSPVFEFGGDSAHFDGVFSAKEITAPSSGILGITATGSISLGAKSAYENGYKVYVTGNLYVKTNVYAEGPISGSNIVNRSDRKIKKNILPTKTKNALSSVKSLSIYDYDLKDVEKSVKMGLMADEAPKEILSDDGDGISLYSYCGLLAMAIKELNEKVEGIENGGVHGGRKD